MNFDSTSVPQEYVFVYGTLRKIGSNAWRMDGATFLGAATAKGHLYRVDWYPAAIFDNSANSIIVGELYSLHLGQLQALDTFEGTEYRRIKISVTTTQEVYAWAWEYIEPIENLKTIISGDWLTER